MTMLKWLGEKFAEAWIKAIALVVLTAAPVLLAGVYEPFRSWAASASWIPTACLVVSLLALCTALIVGRLPARKKREFIKVYETRMDVMWKLKATSLSWWLESDLDRYSDLDEWIVGPYHAKNNCMHQLQWGDRGGYGRHSTLCVPDVCPMCNAEVYEKPDRLLPLAPVKLHTLKALQRLHHRRIRIRDGLRFDSLAG